MSVPEFLLLAAALLAVLFLFGRLAYRPPEQAGKPPRGESRWQRFRFEASALLEGKRGAAVLAEEPDGLRLLLLEGSGRDFPLLLGEAPGNVTIRLERRLLTCTPVLVLRVAGCRWLSLKLSGRNGFPELRACGGPQPENVPAASQLALQGSLADREYEIRACGRLAVSATRNAGQEGAGGPPGRYCVEVVKTTETRAMLALIVALELAASLQDSPPSSPVQIRGAPSR